MNSPSPGQPSVFSMLEKLQSPMARNSELPPEGSDEQDARGMEVAEDGSSLMLCSPLIPQRDSLVEIAETEYVSFNEAGRVVAENYRSPLRQVYTIDDIEEDGGLDGDEGQSQTHQATAGGDIGEGSSQMEERGYIGNNATDREGQPNNAPETSKSIFRWPWSKTEEERQAEERAKEEKKQAEAKAKEERKLKKLMWVPSPTKISLQTMWWGYRMSVNPRGTSSVTN